MSLDEIFNPIVAIALPALHDHIIFITNVARNDIFLVVVLDNDMAEKQIDSSTFLVGTVSNTVSNRYPDLSFTVSAFSCFELRVLRDHAEPEQPWLLID